jgi:hypothetical protein
MPNAGTNIKTNNNAIIIGDMITHHLNIQLFITLFMWQDDFAPYFIF